MILRTMERNYSFSVSQIEKLFDWYQAETKRRVTIRGGEQGLPPASDYNEILDAPRKVLKELYEECSKNW